MSSKSTKKKMPVPKSQSRPTIAKNKQRQRGGVGVITNRGTLSTVVSVNQTNNTKSSSTIVKDEFVQQISGITTFADNIFSVNPGLTGTFPWLASIAQNYQRYKFDSLEFYYRPLVSAYSTAGQIGKVVLSFNVDAADQAVSSISGLENISPSADGMPFEQIRLVVPPRDMNRQMDAHYVRGSVLPPGDIKTYDCGLLHVGVSGTSNTSTIGELRVRYRVSFENSVVPSTLLNAPVAQEAVCYTFNGATGNAYTLGSGYIIQGLTLQVGSSNMFTNNNGTLTCLTPGNYLVCGFIKVADASANITEADFKIEQNGVNVPAGSTFPSVKEYAAVGGAGFFNQPLAQTVLVRMNALDTLLIAFAGIGSSSDSVTLYGSLTVLLVQ